MSAPRHAHPRRRHAVRAVLGVVVVAAAATGGALVVAGSAEAAQQSRVVAAEHRRVEQVAAQGAFDLERDFARVAAQTSSRNAGLASSAAHAQVLAGRTNALAAAQGTLEGSAGKVPETLRTELAASIEVLRTSGDVHTRIAAAQTSTADLCVRVSAAVSLWDAEQAAQQAAAAAAKQSAKSARTPAVAPPAGSDVAPASGSIRDVGEAELQSLPNSAGITIHWDDPDLHGHLGSVWVGGGSYLMVNSARLAGNPSKTRDVIRHEIAHVYQTRVTSSAGISVDDLRSTLSDVFGGNGLETSADCVALRFGASWTHYTTSCSGDMKQGWVDALIAGRLP